jgi:hypothetical protein
MFKSCRFLVSSIEAPALMKPYLSTEKPMSFNFTPAATATQRLSKLIWSLTMSVMSIAALSDNSHAQSATFQLDNGITGPGRFEVIVQPAGGTSFAAVFPLDTSASAFDLISEFTPFVQLGATGGARQLSLSGNNTVTFIAQTGIVRSTGVLAGPNGAINWVSEARLIGRRLENTITFSSAAPFGAVRFISFLDASVVDRAATLAPTSAPDFSLLYFSSDTTRPTGIAHGIHQAQLVNASYAGWVMRESNRVFGNIVDPVREVFSLPGVLDPLVITAPDTRFPFSTVYRIFQSDTEPGSAYAVDLNAAATTATVVTHLTGFPQIQSDPVFRNGFEN